MLLYSLGRYQEALAGFRHTEELDPFGIEQAQIEIFNQVVTLLALGRDREAAVTATRLRATFARYAAELLATYRGRWAEAESLAAGPAGDPSTSPVMKVPAVTMLAGARAALGQPEAAGTQLLAAASAADGPARHWYANAAVLLAAAQGRTPGPVPRWLLADTTAGGEVAAGLWAAMIGDSAAARRRLASLERRPAVQQRRLGLGPALVRGYLLAAEGRWDDLTRALGGAAIAGERDGGDLDQVSGAAVRWLAARGTNEPASRTRPPSCTGWSSTRLAPRSATWRCAVWRTCPRPAAVRCSPMARHPKTRGATLRGTRQVPRALRNPHEGGRMKGMLALVAAALVAVQGCEPGGGGPHCDALSAVSSPLLI